MRDLGTAERPADLLLTWGYVKVDAAAFCLQHNHRHGESAGPVET
jgi:hypothetical protein